MLIGAAARKGPSLHRTCEDGSMRAQVFNGGSDFNEPVKRCLDRLHTAAWANSDILLVSDGELRQPGSEIMRKLSGGDRSPPLPSG